MIKHPMKFGEANIKFDDLFVGSPKNLMSGSQGLKGMPSSKDKQSKSN